MSSHTAHFKHIRSGWCDAQWKSICLTWERLSLSPVLVSFLLLWYKYQMTKATYKECVAYVSPEWESITAGRHGDKWQISRQAHTAERSHLEPKAGSREHKLQVGGGLKLPKPDPGMYYFQGGCISRPSPNNITQWGPSVQMLRTRRDISHSNHRNPHLGKEERGNSHSFLNEVDPIFQQNNRTKETQNHPFTDWTNSTSFFDLDGSFKLQAHW